MNYKEVILENKLNILTIAAYIIALIYSTEIFFSALDTTWMYIKEMLQILPAVFIITGLIEIWVPRETIMKTFGSSAGIKGKVISVFIGSVSAGPIYAAFPVTQSLLKKGASLANIVIILSAWAVVKIPMLIVETKFLGIPFMVTRYILTVPGIIILGIILEKVMNREEVIKIAKEMETDLEEEVMEILPGHNCGSCGYGDCKGYAEAIANDNVDLDKCDPGGEKVQNQLKNAIENKQEQRN